MGSSDVSDAELLSLVASHDPHTDRRLLVAACLALVLVTVPLTVGDVPDDSGVKLRLDGFGGQWDTAADVLLEIVGAHGGGM